MTFAAGLESKEQLAALVESYQQQVSTLTTQRDMLVKALAPLNDVIEELGHTLDTDFDFWSGIPDQRRIPVYTAWSFLNELNRLTREALQHKEGV